MPYFKRSKTQNGIKSDLFLCIFRFDFDKR